MPTQQLNGTQAALAADNTRLVSFMVKRRKNVILSSKLSLDDAWQAGAEGLCRAALRYDPSRGMFSTYAVPYIDGHILKACNKNPMIHKRIRDAYVHYETVALSGFEGIYDNLDDRVAAREMIGKLIDAGGKIMWLRLLDNSQQQIGKRLGLSQAQVSRSLNRAIVSVREAI